MKTLVLIPVRPGLPEELKRRCFDQAVALQTMYGSTVEVVLDGDGPGEEGTGGLEGRAARMCAIRQNMINTYLDSRHTHVLWIDADIFYSPDILERLMGTESRGIAAPCVLLEGHPGRFYDIRGFVEPGAKETPMMHPWFRQRGPIVNMNSVGAFYLVLADIYRFGASHTPTIGYTEHWSVCQSALQTGHPVVCDTRLSVIHAFLPNYGEKAHGKRV